ncbi:hypothetical protein HBE99_04610 [Mycobacteroides chelonae]|uniref:hypothetical protein n=1 Tax=Mycobacteroides chelonae TaxID=1774 RepID=UPI0019100F4A|nr:hypothetical protein [Mycobacteroides chelonae]QQG96225.1 hypothetical protein HBE99_04610 [Mycobacteroides chelonae]
MAVWRQQPLEIEADLFFRGVDIMDWHRGTMSSRRFLVLVSNLPETSEYKRSHSTTGWTDLEEILAESHKVQAMNLLSKYGKNDTKPELPLFIPPKERYARAVEAKERARIRKQVSGDLFSQIGWS